MTYTKPKNVRYVDMAIYIDSIIYSKELTEKEQNTVYEYLYHLFNMLAIKHKYFKKASDYDEYCLMAAKNAYYRLTNKKQFLPDDDPKKLPKIKSILNWVKNVAYGFKVNYQKEYFNEVTNGEDTELNNNLHDKVVERIIAYNNDFVHVEFTYYLDKISNTIKDFIYKLPYSSNKKLSHYIYISCLISLLKSITLSNSNKVRLDKRRFKPSEDDLIDRLYKEETDNSVTLYHLPQNMYNYIDTLVKEIRHLIVNDLKDIIGSYEPSDQVIKSILASSYENYNSNGVDNNDQE